MNNVIIVATLTVCGIYRAGILTLTFGNSSSPELKTRHKSTTLKIIKNHLYQKTPQCS